MKNRCTLLKSKTSFIFDLPSLGVSTLANSAMEPSLPQSKRSPIQQKTYVKAINPSAVLYTKGQRRVVPHDHQVDDQGTTNSPDIWDCGSPLYDLYELVSVSSVIERNIMVFPSPAGSKPFIFQSQQHQQHESMSSKSKVDQKSSGFSAFGSCFGMGLWKRKTGKGGKSKKWGEKFKNNLNWFV